MYQLDTLQGRPFFAFGHGHGNTSCTGRDEVDSIVMLQKLEGAIGYQLGYHGKHTSTKYLVHMWSTGTYIPKKNTQKKNTRKLWMRLGVNLEKQLDWPPTRILAFEMYCTYTCSHRDSLLPTSSGPSFRLHIWSSPFQATCYPLLDTF